MNSSATSEGTLRYAKKFSNTIPPSHFRTSSGLTLSSIGIGTYLGDPAASTDISYSNAIVRAVELGCNHIDTAINYRFQRSERAVGMALRILFGDLGFMRDEVVVATKGGYIPFDGFPPQDIRSYLVETFIEPGIATLQEIVGGIHCMSPKYLENQLECSLNNLGLDSIDIYYIHNPEEQLAEVNKTEFLGRLARAFELLESKVEEGKIRFYGTATWNGYREEPTSKGHLNLEELVGVAESIGGKHHHFRFIQLPFNLAMPEALILKNQRVGGSYLTPLEAALELGLSVIGSSSLLQSHLARGLPPFIGEHLRRLKTDAQRAIQFARSIPGITSSLVGMSDINHVEENMALAKIPPASIKELEELFENAKGR
jgi:aryl-alcohol dehydrogenase-like predicted oxidoreductase